MPSEENKEDIGKSINFVCPICKKEKKIKILASKLSKSATLTTISIQKNEICEHHFQAFIDKNYVIRGYQKVDFEIDSKNKLPKGDFFMKSIIAGDYKVGKTAITRRFVENKFEQGYLPTLQLKISKKNINFGSTNLTYVIWDIGGQVFHMSPYRTQFYEGAQSAVIVVDRTRYETLENAQRWYEDTLKVIKSKIPFILVGNKSDLNGEIVVSEKDIIEKAKELDLKYLLTSAKTDYNVTELFLQLYELFFQYKK